MEASNYAQQSAAPLMGYELGHNLDVHHSFLAAVRRLTYEAADAGLLSPDLAAGMRRVKGAKKHGTRVGNWLTAEQGRVLLSIFDRAALRGKRD